MKRFKEVMWLIALIGLTLTILGMFINGTIQYYVHPDKYNIVLFGVAVIGIVAIYQCIKLFTYEVGNKSLISILIFMLPVVLALVIEPSDINVNVLLNKGVDFGEKNITYYSSLEYDFDESVIEECNDPTHNHDSDTCDDPTHNHEHVQENDVYGEIFLNEFNAISSNVYGNKGKEVVLRGIIVDLGNNQEDLALIRPYMSCCAADSQGIGFSVEASDNEINSMIGNLEKSWVEITGVIEEEYVASKVKEELFIRPKVIITNIEEIETPQEQYIYN